MKSKIILMALTLYSTSLIGQRTVDINKQWHIYNSNSWNPNPPTTDIYDLKNDTVINQQKYLQLFVNGNPRNQWGSPEVFLREDSLNRIYMFINGEENLLYDYNLLENDTITVNGYFGSCLLKVVEVDSITLLNGDIRKRIKLIKNGDTPPDQPYFGFKSWVEGIGSLTSLTGYISSCGTDYTLQMSCYFENEELIYSGFGFNDCSLTSIEESDVQPIIKIYPNPVNDVLYIEGDYNEISCTIYNLSGKKILESSKNEIEINNLRNGLYIVEIQTDKYSWTKKLIKE